MKNIATIAFAVLAAALLANPALAQDTHAGGMSISGLGIGIGAGIVVTSWRELSWPAPTRRVRASW